MRNARYIQIAHIIIELKVVYRRLPSRALSQYYKAKVNRIRRECAKAILKETLEEDLFQLYSMHNVSLVSYAKLT